MSGAPCHSSLLCCFYGAGTPLPSGALFGATPSLCAASVARGGRRFCCCPQRLPCWAQGWIGCWEAQAGFLLLFGPIPEELAWRGYAQGRLEERWRPLGACVLLGIFWLAWHLPLTAIEGSYQHSLGLGPRFWLFVADKLPMTLVLGWAWRRNGRSTLAAIGLHWAINLTGELLDLSLRAEAFMIGGWWLLAVALVLLGGRELRWPRCSAAVTQPRRLPVSHD